MAATDARTIPLKGLAFRVTFPIRDNDGDLVTGATGLDSERSLDAGTFSDCTNEATEIATSSGMYYLDLTAAEMAADTVTVIVKTTSTDAKTTVLVLYPETPEFVEGTATDSPTTTSVNVTVADDRATGFYNGRQLLIVTGTGVNQRRRITSSTRSSATKQTLAFSGSAGQPDAALGTAPASADRVRII
jgi:hypothetical protein